MVAQLVKQDDGSYDYVEVNTAKKPVVPDLTEFEAYEGVKKGGEDLVSTPSITEQTEKIQREIPSQVRHIDFMPTILDLMEIKLDSSYELLDGKSLIPLINGSKFKENIAYSETGNPWDGKTPPKSPNTKAVRTSKWKLIFNEYNNTKELYDLENDPDENNNLIGKNSSVENFLWNELTKIQPIK